MAKIISKTIDYLNSEIRVNTKINEVRLLKNNNTFLIKFGGMEDDEGHYIQQTSDGGYIITGFTRSYGAGYSDVWLIKMDSFGKIEWNKTLGGSGVDYASSVQQTSDGGYIITGETGSYGAEYYDIWLIKTDNFGNLEWNKTFGEEGYYNYGNSVQQTSDEGYIITGGIAHIVIDHFESNTWLIKTNSVGNMEWNKSFGLEGQNVGTSVQETSDGGYIITGCTESYGAGMKDIWLIKTNSSGDMQWNKTFGGTKEDIGNSIQLTSDGGYIITGISGGDIWLIKTNSSGDMQWNKTFGDTDRGESVQQTSDSGYIITGSTNHYGNLLLLKTDSIGNIQWNKTYEGKFNDWGRSVCQTFDSGYIIVGVTRMHSAGNGDILLIKTDSSGNFIDTGNFISVNLLEKQNALSINSFNYSTFIPSGTNIQIQFSNDNIKWYNSSGSLNGWDLLINGSNSIDLSYLNWNGFKFYYKVKFSSEYINVPFLQNINLSYIKSPDSDGDNMPDTWEIQYELNPFNSSDANQDQDNDGFNNKEEYDANTDPSDPDDYPQKDNNKDTQSKDFDIVRILSITIIEADQEYQNLPKQS